MPVALAPETQADDVVVASMSFKLVHEKSDPIRAAVDFAVQADENISSNILAAALNGVDKRGQRMINLAKRGDFYAGLPTITIGEEVEIAGTRSIQNTEEIEETTCYPIVALRENWRFIGGNDIDNPVKDEKYKHTRRMMKKLNIKLKDIFQGIEGTEEEPNPDLDKLDDTFFSFATDVYSTIESTLEYQWNFFDWLMGQAIHGEPEEPPPGEEPAPSGRNLIQFAEYEGTENQFYCTFLFDYITKETENNVFLKDPREGHEYKSVDYTKELFAFELNGGPSRIVIRKQVEFGVVEKITVYSPSHRVAIDAKGEVKRVETGLKEEFFNLPPEDERAGTGAFYIPMIMEIVELATNKHEQIALYDGCMLILFAAEEVDLKWYQTTWFKVIMTIVSIVIQFVPIFGQALSVTIQNIMIAIFKTIVLGFILGMIIQVVASEFGAFAAAILVLAAYYYGGRFRDEGLPFANDLLKATSSVIKAVNIEAHAELRDEIEDFDKTYREKQEAIKEANDLLSSGGLDPTLLIQAYNGDIHESPDDFFTRTIHTGNLADIALSAVSEYVDRMLLVPEFDPYTQESMDGKTPYNQNAQATI